ncbi:MAG: hypothetical protein QG608_1362 [Actinomycetota bacterium]|nr:hypothetical protein [Actinomycetota bacterium]
MPTRRSQPDDGEKRAPITRDQVLHEALALADEGGVEALTIRAVAENLGVTPMALYHHIRNKDEIVNGMLDLVMDEIELPAFGGRWQTEMARRATSARHVLNAHPWAIHLLQAGSAPGPATLRHHNAVIGVLREAGFTVIDTAHAFALLDSYLYGFALSETTLPIHGPQAVTDVAQSMMARSTEQGHPMADYPHLFEFSTEHILAPGYEFGAEFEFGLDLILDALERALGSR